MVLPPPNTRTCIGFFELPVALVVQVLLFPCIQDQTGGIASVTINRGEAPIKVGRANGMEIEMLEMPMFEREQHLSMHRVSGRKTRVSYLGRRPSISGANTQAAAAERTQTPMTPSKIVKRKSLGFVRLGFGGGNAHAMEGEYLGLGLGVGRRAADRDD
jgi:hypothetical protein